MVHEELTPGGLRRFALVTAALLALVFGLLLPMLWEAAYPAWPWIGAAALALWGLLAPSTLRRPYAWWMRMALALGWVNNRLVLSVAFVALVIPVGLVRRLFGDDPMRRKLDRPADSYRIVRPKHGPSDPRRPF